MVLFWDGEASAGRWQVGPDPSGRHCVVRVLGKCHLCVSDRM